VNAPRLASGGFTLIEAIVSTTIVAIAFSVVFGGISTSARGTARIEEADRQLEAARSILAAIDVLDRIRVDDRASGVTPNGFPWRVETRAFIPARSEVRFAVVEVVLEVDSHEGIDAVTWSVPTYKTVEAPETAPPLEDQLDAIL
jgi:hypothetical protein